MVFICLELHAMVNPSWIVYLIGIVLFGLFYELVKANSGGDVLFVIVGIGYLIILRVMADFLAKKCGK